MEYPGPDVTEMLAVHQVFRDALGLAPVVIGGVDQTDAHRIELVASFYANVLDFLHAHHAGEDAVLFPLLRERCRDQLEVVDRVAGQHADVNDLHAASLTNLTKWAAGEQDGRCCATTLGELGKRLTQHLDDEETDVLPLCGDHVSAQEWGQLPAHGMAHFGGDKIWLILGLVQQRLSPVQRADMLAHLPPPALDMWTNIGQQAFTGFMAELGPPLESSYLA